VTGTWNRSEHP